MSAIPVDAFLNIALSKYYNTHKIGKKSDFITSPEISSIFAEVIACFIINFIVKNNISLASLVEIGGGNGKLMNDICNTIASLKFLNKISSFVSIEKSKLMQNLQKKLLPKETIFLNSIDDLTTATPLIIISNEFFDALPIKQCIFKNNKWHEILVDNNKLVVSSTPSNINMAGKESDVLELPVAGLDLFKTMAQKVKQSKGMLLTIDYGFKKHQFGSTLQALKQHKKADFLTDIGNCDITHLVQFEFFEKMAKSIGLSSNIVTQKDFLVENGILARSQNQSQNVKEAVKRLIDDGKGGMGNFLVMTNQ